MQIREILHPGVVKMSAMCEVGGRVGGGGKRGTKLFISLRKCHYSQMRRRRGPRVVKQSLAWIAGFGTGVCLYDSIMR